MSYRLIEGSCFDVLPTLPEKSAQCVVTSPPYFGLRDYGVAGQIGLEPTMAEYIDNLVDIFGQVRRVLKDDGCLWLNLGDSYSTNPGNGRGGETKMDGGTPHRSAADKTKNGLKAKNLLGIPWRVAFALQDDGWILRSDIIWAKPNPMPESVTDRPTRSHEYIFLLTKSAKYYYDADAIREEAARAGDAATFGGLKARSNQMNGGDPRNGHRTDENSQWGKDCVVASARNKRDVWTVAPATYADAHFATFPPALIEPCILAGSRTGDTVLDPFNGSGTTGAVALEHHRQYIGIDLNPEYIELSHKRIGRTQFTLPLETALVVNGEHPLPDWCG